jgi:hypothetical protein
MAAPPFWGHEVAGGRGRTLIYSDFDEGAAARFCHGQRPVISTSSEKLKKVRIRTIAASMATLVRVG